MAVHYEHELEDEFSMVLSFAFTFSDGSSQYYGGGFSGDESAEEEVETFTFTDSTPFLGIKSFQDSTFYTHQVEMYRALSDAPVGVCGIRDCSSQSEDEALCVIFKEASVSQQSTLDSL